MLFWFQAQQMFNVGMMTNREVEAAHNSQPATSQAPKFDVKNLSFRCEVVSGQELCKNCVLQ